MNAATAVAHPNIALVKYWGKRDTELNLPSAGSVSITLDTIRTRTTVRFDADLSHDVMSLNGTDQPLPKQVIATLDRMRVMAQTDLSAAIDSDNNFPTAAGLASSASGYAALVKACDAALRLGLADSKLSELARRGSGSAARSIFGGYASMNPGSLADGSDAVARPLLSAASWPLAVVIAVTSTGSKKHSSTAGMNRSRDTSPYFQEWTRATPADRAIAHQAIRQRDFDALAEVSESSCLKMHACMLSSLPGLIYWNGATVEAMHCVRRLRDDGLPVFFTIDAGPQLKAICLPPAATQVADALEQLPGVQSIIRTGLGDAAKIVATPE